MGLKNKIMTMEDAAAMIPNGAHLAISGFANSLCPAGFVRQMIRNHIRNLEISAMGEAFAVDLLCAAGALKKVRISNFMLEGNGRCPNFSRAVETGYTQVEDYSHFGITSRFFAGAVGLPFMPVKSMIGSDIFNVRSFDGENKVREMECPFTGEKVAVVPKVEPDFAIIHAARADKNGNVQLFGITSSTEQIAKCAKKVIAVVEEIVDESVIRNSQEFTILPSFFVDVVVHQPYGAHPTGIYRYYDFDKAHLDSYARAGRDPEKIKSYLDEYVYGTKNEMEYLDKIGLKRLMDLRADYHSGISLRNRGEL